MTNVKRSGKRWERELAKELGGQRQPSSGAFGTQHGDMALAGDVIVEYPYWHCPIHIEAKYGYGTSKSMRIQREWFTKVRKEARKARRYPAVSIKFRDVTGGDIGSAKSICFNIDVWKEMMEEISLMYSEYLTLLEKEYERNSNDE